MFISLTLQAIRKSFNNVEGWQCWSDVSTAFFDKNSFKKSWLLLKLFYVTNSKQRYYVDPNYPTINQTKNKQIITLPQTTLYCIHTSSNPHKSHPINPQTRRHSTTNQTTNKSLDYTAASYYSWSINMISMFKGINRQITMHVFLYWEWLNCLNATKRKQMVSRPDKYY